MTCPVNKIDSNITGLRYAEEQCLKQLPASPIFYPLDPNSYSDFGGQITTKARKPINAARQQKKGVVTDLQASGGFTQDITQTNLLRLMQGFLFANAHQKPDTQPLNSAALTAASVTAATKTIALSAALAGVFAGDLVLCSGFGVAANNGVKEVTSASGVDIVVDSAADEAAPPAAARVQVVGLVGASGDFNIEYTAGSLPQLTSTALDFTTVGLILGEWIFVGGDAAGDTFANNVGFARVSAIAAHALTFDKTSWTPAAEVGTSKTIRLYFGTLIRNESDPALIKRRSYDIERTLGNDADGVMSEHLIGAVANELTINFKQGDIVTADMKFVACDNAQRTGAQGLVAGARPALVETDAFNSVSDLTRINLSSVDPATSAPKPLFAFSTDASVVIKNNASENKGLGILGAFDISVGMFEVSGNLTTYFADVLAVQAVRNNGDVTLDIVMVKANAGTLIDLPLITLGNGRLSVEQDKAIMLPLDVNAAQSSYGNTMTFQSFAYLPDAAA